MVAFRARLLPLDLMLLKCGADLDCYPKDTELPKLTHCTNRCFKQKYMRYVYCSNGVFISYS